MKTYFCSDLHLGHKNILKYEPSRIDAIWEMFYKDNSQYTKNSFKEFVLSLYEDTSTEAIDKLKYILSLHDKMLIKNWNETVSSDDVVWFLGDFCFGGGDAKYYLSKLNGHVRLIKGNHDKKSDTYYRDAGFEFVSNYPVVLKRHFILMHAPLETFVPGFFYVFGHVHSSPNYETKTDNTICACIERHKFKPFLILDFDKYVDEPKKYPIKGDRE